MPYRFDDHQVRDGVDRAPKRIARYHALTLRVGGNLGEHNRLIPPTRVLKAVRLDAAIGTGPSRWKPPECLASQKTLRKSDG